MVGRKQHHQTSIADSAVTDKIPSMSIPLFYDESNQNRRQHEEDSVIPSMLFCEHHRQLNSQHILETSKPRDEKRHRHEEDQQPFFELGHENGFV